MNNKLIFATSNLNKVKEVNQLLEGVLDVGSLQDIGCTEDVPETQPTIEGNARQKAQYVYDHYGVDCFAEDTGLEIDSLNGEPGVYSARYAGPARDSNANMQKVLEKLGNSTERRARFRTVVALIEAGEITTYEGVVEGNIIFHARGQKGFGYDPIFQPLESQLTFAEMDASTKNEISHRARAIRKFLNGLKEKHQA